MQVASRYDCAKALLIASRVSAALFASYLTTWSMAYTAALLLPTKPTETVILTSVAGIIVYIALMLWSFVGDLRTVWLVQLAAILASAAAAFLVEASR